jgi:hypothetical protein
MFGSAQQSAIIVRILAFTSGARIDAEEEEKGKKRRAREAE